MRRAHFYVMGLIALGYGVITMAEYLLIAYGEYWGWLDMYSADQLAWLQAVPIWIQGVWGAHAVLALVGALCLLGHVRASVWMLSLSFLTVAILAVWALFFASPTMIAMTGGGWQPWAATACVVLLTLVLYLYARGEKQAGEVL